MFCLVLVFFLLCISFKKRNSFFLVGYFFLAMAQGLFGFASGCWSQL